MLRAGGPRRPRRTVGQIRTSAPSPSSASARRQPRRRKLTSRDKTRATNRAHATIAMAALPRFVVQSATVRRTVEPDAPPATPDPSPPRPQVFVDWMNLSSAPGACKTPRRISDHDKVTSQQAKPEPTSRLQAACPGCPGSRSASLADRFVALRNRGWSGAASGAVSAGGASLAW